MKTGGKGFFCLLKATQSCDSPLQHLKDYHIIASLHNLKEN